MSKLQIIFFNAGGGHRSTAIALAKQLCLVAPNTSIHQVDIQSPSLLGSLDILQRLTGFSVVGLYNHILQNDLTAWDPLYLKFSRVNIRVLHRYGLRILIDHWRQTTPDIVISLIPLFNSLLVESLETALPNARFLTVMTDLADSPPSYWFQKPGHPVICPTAKAVEQGLQLGYSSTDIIRTSGLVLSPDFYLPVEHDRATERLQLGLKPDRPTALLMSGANGASSMVEIIRKLNSIHFPFQMICLCGRVDDDTKQAIGFASRHPIFVEGYTERVPYFMSLCDLFIGKPGNICVCEAVHMNLPVITHTSSATLVQERYTSTWLDENQYGITVKSWGDIAMAVTELMELSTYSTLKANVRGSRNQGLHETVEFITDSLLP